MIKFYLGQTMQITERVTVEEMEVPQVVFCTKHPFKEDVLSQMGDGDFLLRTFHTYTENINIPDIGEVWEKGTYSMSERLLQWSLLNGKCH